MTAEFAFLDTPRPIAFAHRGGAAGGVENSMAAFEAAIGLGYRYLETDVHATADGRLVAFHDTSLDRVTDRTGLIAQLPYREVARARIGGREPIPLLEDLLGAWPDARFNIDVKVAGAIGPLAEVIRRTGAIDRVCVGSFSDARIARTRAALGPRLCTALGPRRVLALRASSYLRPAVPGPAACAQVPTGFRALRIIDHRFIGAAHKLGLDVHVWTIDDATEMHRLLDLGVDGIMTDEIQMLRDVLAQRGQWRCAG
jgi:glycerophosphoryl diester phosphodiesterase